MCVRACVCVCVCVRACACVLEGESEREREGGRKVNITLHCTSMTISNDSPVRNLLSNHVGDELPLHAPLDKLAESVVGVWSIKNNVGHVIEHTDETLQKIK